MLHCRASRFCLICHLYFQLSEGTRNTLFGQQTGLVKTCTFETIGQYFVNKLRNVFPSVAENPLTLYNSRNIPLFMLCFAAANKKGGSIAKRIAEYILSR